uniref:Ribonuclease HII n=1 Tax=viral metagenome TaxID=1070528 RepID=A0A6C0J7B3_9ZZZZ
MTTTLQKCMKSCVIEVGLDEAGRGPGLGPVYTSAVIWGDYEDENTKLLVKDSKLIASKKMICSYEYVIKHAHAYVYDYADVEEIIKYGIYNANMRSLHRCLDKLIDKGYLIEHILMDGNSFHKYKDISYDTVVKGDSKYYSIAAASIIAKYNRDKYINKLCNTYPILKNYGIHTNMGYLSSKHQAALKKYGYTEFHRHTWKNFKGLLYSPIKKPIIKKQVIVIKKNIT